MNGFDLQYQYQREEVKKFVDKIKEIQRDEKEYPNWAESELRKFFDLQS